MVRGVLNGRPGKVGQLVKKFKDMGGVMEDERVQSITAGYHDLVTRGRREIYSVES